MAYICIDEDLPPSLYPLCISVQSREVDYAPALPQVRKGLD